MRLAVRDVALSLLVSCACISAHGYETHDNRPARSILIRESTSAGNENAELRQHYDQALATKLASLSKWLVRTESSDHVGLSEEERARQFTILGIEYYLQTSIGIDRRERVEGGLELVVVVTLSRYPKGRIWREEFIGTPADIDLFADEVAKSVYSLIGDSDPN